jgi:hypothetical protein
VLVVGYVDTGDTCHAIAPLFPSALALLVPGFCAADHPDHATALHHFAAATDLLD